MTFYSLFLLIFFNIERMIRDYGGWHLEVQTTFMIECSHLCGIAWDYHDGTEPEKDLSPEQKKCKLQELPTILEFFASSLSPTQLIAGPPSNFIDFKDYIYRKGDFENIPSTFIPCLKSFFTGMLIVPFYIFCNSYFPLSILGSPDFIGKGVIEKVTNN